MAADARDTSSGVRSFRCPSCAASLEVVDAPSVKCRYCGTDVPVPRELRPQESRQPQVVVHQIQLGSPQLAEATKFGRRIGALVGAIVLVVALGAIGLGFYASRSAITNVKSVLKEVPVQAPSAPEASQKGRAQGGEESGVKGSRLQQQGFAQIVQEFGVEGSGPGQMDDARQLTIDADGNIWTADYSDGRVQQFDPTGKFLQLIHVPPDRNDSVLIQGLAADLKGNLYVSRGGDILKYSTADGRPLATFTGRFPKTWYEALAVDAQNNVYAVHTAAGGEAVIKLSPAGKQLARWDDIVKKVNKKDSVMELGIAVDGLGTIYLASNFGDQVYSYDAKGEFIDRFGRKGDEPGQLDHPTGLAVDGRKHLYIYHHQGIDQFDTSGRFIGKLPIDRSKGSPRTVAVDRNGFVYTVTAEGKVLKYLVNAQEAG